MKGRTLRKALGRNVAAYLVECRSWWGFSGSPVFIHYAESRIAKLRLPRGSEKRVSLLGLIHGEYEQGKMNSGLSVVIPSKHILELLMTRDAMRQRDEIRQAQEASRPKPRPASVSRRGVRRRMPKRRTR